MIFQSICPKERLNFLTEKYIDLMESGVNTGEIIVLLLNSYQKTLFSEKLKVLKKGLYMPDLKIYTLYGLCYSSFIDNKDYIKKLLDCDKSEELNLCGLEVSQYIFKQCIKEADFSDYISKVNLLHQLFRRYSLIVQNCLTADEIKERSEFLNETFSGEAQKAINEYKKKTIECRSFDYLRQLAILPYIYNNTGYFKNIKYLLANDADEYSYAFWKFISQIAKQLKEIFIAYDKDGSSRCGYLCAYKNGISDFKKNYPQKEIAGRVDKKFKTEAQNLFNAIKEGKKAELDTVKAFNFVSRFEMISNAVSKAEELLNTGVKPQEISIITPVCDDVLISGLEENNFNMQFQMLSGGEKLSDIEFCSFILSVLKLVNNIEIKPPEFQNLIINLLKIPYRACYPVIKEYENTKKIRDFSFDNQMYYERYKKFKTSVEALKISNNKLSGQIKIIFENIVEPQLKDYDEKKYKFLIKEAQSFETAFADSVSNLAKEFVIQTENSIISENPADSFEIRKNSIIVSSPQKITDYSIETKYQIWLDISSNEWQKRDTGTLYNAWVFNRDWNKKEYTFEEDIKYAREKTARTARKLFLLCGKEIYMYSSLYDGSGFENFGGLNDYISDRQKTSLQLKIEPRADQKEVLNYKSGKMGIMAVPGAGKTTMLLLLVIKLIQSGAKPENIFVLTYMESSAKNFKEKIQNLLPENTTLPNISTIHGLALRIIKENGNYNKIGLDENFEICSDSSKERIIKELFYKLKIDDDKTDIYTKCISNVKLSMNKSLPVPKYSGIKKFFEFYSGYNIYLKSQNMLDYDDMLCYAVKILNENPDILRYYQNLCRYIIEDEAQDSTNIQQELISLLAEKYQNYVRCGDINQSITSTFTNSCLESFKNFMNNNKKAEMCSSQRCAETIYSLANALVKLKNETNAFYPIEMTGTKNNPLSGDKPSYNLFDSEKQEKIFLLEKIKYIKKQNPKASVAILLRLNCQVDEYNDYLMSNSVKTDVRLDCLAQKSIYKLIFALINAVNNPMNSTGILNLAKCYELMRIKNFTDDEYKLITSNSKTFYIRNFDDIETENLKQLYLDLDYWLNKNKSDMSDLALKIGRYYSKNISDKANTYIISAFIKRLENNAKTAEELISQIDYYANKPLNSLKLFEDETSADDTGVKIMTMHKSKGDEFDYVFIPEFNEENYATKTENVKLKTGSHFVQTIKNFTENMSKQKTQDNLKTEHVNETLRLIYVGITRAKSGLYFSNSKNYKRRKNTKNISFFENLPQINLY